MTIEYIVLGMAGLAVALLMWWLLRKIPADFDREVDEQVRYFERLQAQDNEKQYRMGYAWALEDYERMREGLQARGIPAAGTGMLLSGYRAGLRACGAEMVREIVRQPEIVGEG